ncbi:hypothetical protein M405DRAFT_596226 [Rhizopogon salebrosus TDB-379]|nr:hypothetical protein M405DRAFT_596226 [Rhizopogon salebrosus TDB-379]
MMRLRSATLLSLVSQPIDLPSPGTRIPTISHPTSMTELPPDILSSICLSLLPRGALSRVHNDLTLSPLSNSSPTAVVFAEARAGRFFRLLSDANDLGDICRDRYKS